jgi:hypothetical protein
MNKPKNAWRWWSKALGEKASKCDRESDKIAIIRSFIFLTYLITNCFIVAGVLRHWNDNPQIEVYVEQSHNEVQGDLSETKKEGILKTNRNFLYN